MTLGGCDFELAGSGSQGMTPDTCDGEGEGLTGAGATTCRRENASATSATKKTRAAARESSRTIERRAVGWGAPVRAMMVACNWTGGSVPTLKAGASRRRLCSSSIEAPLMQG